MATLNIISAGAMQAVVTTLIPVFEKASGATGSATYGAVGQQKARVLAGDPADVILLTPEMLDDLAATGWVVPGSQRTLGRVGMGVVVPKGHPAVDVSTPDALRDTMLAASLVVYPDPQIASAGRNFDNALIKLGIRDALADRIRHFPNGNVSMTWLGEQRIPGSIGVTQVSEIKPIPTIDLLAEIPGDLQVITAYGAARAVKGGEPALGQAFFDLLCSAQGRAVIVAAGFSPVD
ncbi:MAG: substrate-binding domain-containing protein [Proteobacteria bacterium]|nr:substrate-binding domain-containing protein [Pseudomonadota bacterium]